MAKNFQTNDFRDLLIRDLRNRIAELEQELVEYAPATSGRLVPCIQLDRELARNGNLDRFSTRRPVDNGEEKTREGRRPLR